MKAVTIPGFGIVTAFGLSGTNCLLDHVSTIVIGKANQKILALEYWVLMDFHQHPVFV
ncbi:hypothetical protein [Lactiplantibacillus paraxiangfangensis]|uniref:hypothetical protein n=1 Tax=Lactiplantibacillus paraxiangfangensis TaxID=3076224 RepID=UPI0030C6964C